MPQSRPAAVTGILYLAAGLALAAALLAGWLPHCGGEAPMRCLWMTRAAAGTSLALAAAGLFMVFARSAAAAMGLAAGVFLLSLLLASTAGILIGPCPSPMMHCHAVTQPALLVAGALLSLIALADVWRLSRRS